MKAPNNGLKDILNNYIKSICREQISFSTEDEIYNHIITNGKFIIDNAIINFNINIKNILNRLNADFDNDIRITNCDIRKGIVFGGINIKGNLYFWENLCGNCDISYTLINGNAYFSNSVFDGITYFDQSTFNNNCFFWGVTFKSAVTFRECTFNNRIDFWCSEFIAYTDFNFSKFINDVDFSNCLFAGESHFSNTEWLNKDIGANSITFDNAIFDNNCYFNNSDFELNMTFVNVTFPELAEFTGCTFTSNIEIISSNIHIISFLNSRFYSEFTIENITSTSASKINLSSIWFEKLIGIDCSASACHETNIVLNKLIMPEHSILRIEGVNSTEPLYCDDCIISGIISIYNSSFINILMRNSSIIGSVVLKSEVKNIDLSNSTSIGRIVTNSNKCINSANRETANILRAEKEKDGDLILSLEYKEKEMKKYNERIENQKFISKIKNLEEIIILKLNYLSSNFGTSWLRGVLFVFCIAIICTIVLKFIAHDICITKNFSDLIVFKESFWNDAITFLWIPFSSLENISSNGLIYTIIYLIGKILITYGLFQIVISFRKYSNKS